MPYKDPEERKEYARVYARKWSAENADKVAATRETWKKKLADPIEADRRRAYVREWKEKNDWPRKSADKIQELRGQIHDMLGRKCVKCGYDADVRALQIDHINGNGVKERREIYKSLKAYYQHIIEVNGDGYQILCANCNWIKRHENKEFRIGYHHKK